MAVFLSLIVGLVIFIFIIASIHNLYVFDKEDEWLDLDYDQAQWIMGIITVLVVIICITL